MKEMSELMKELRRGGLRWVCDSETSCLGLKHDFALMDTPSGCLYVWRERRFIRELLWELYRKVFAVSVADR